MPSFLLQQNSQVAARAERTRVPFSRHRCWNLQGTVQERTELHRDNSRECSGLLKLFSRGLASTSVSEDDWSLQKQHLKRAETQCSPRASSSTCSHQADWKNSLIHGVLGSSSGGGGSHLSRGDN